MPVPLSNIVDHMVISVLGTPLSHVSETRLRNSSHEVFDSIDFPLAAVDISRADVIGVAVCCSWQQTQYPCLTMRQRIGRSNTQFL